MKNLQYCGGIFDLDEKIERIQELTTKQEDPATWSDRALSQKIGKEKKVLEEIVNQAQQLTHQLSDNEELFEMDALVKIFDTEKIQKGGAKFDFEKARWINHKFLF